MKTHSVPSAPPSRRERPAKPALSRQGIVATALAIMRDEGLEKVTMRRIAAELDTGPASLYVYVQNTEDLHAQILDALLEPLATSPPEAGTWRERLKELLERYMLILYHRPELARMAISTPSSGPHYLTLVETVVTLLEEGGVPGRDAAWAVDLLLLQATATAAEHTAWEASPRAAEDFSTLSAAITTADDRIYPRLARLGGEILSGHPIDRFRWALDVLISGVLAAPRPFTEYLS